MTTRYEARYPLPDGNEGIVTVTLPRIVALIAEPSAAVQARAQALMADASVRAVRHDLEYRVTLASLTFAWLRSHMLYLDDLAQTLRSPEWQLDDIHRFGKALGNCASQIIPLGALYHAEGLPVEVVLVSQREDKEFEHVYLRVDTGEAWLAADPIVDRPFGWEIPAEEVTASWRVRV